MIVQVAGSVGLMELACLAMRHFLCQSGSGLVIVAHRVAWQSRDNRAGTPVSLPKARLWPQSPNRTAGNQPANKPFLSDEDFGT